jgi:hypothetical protein
MTGVARPALRTAGGRPVADAYARPDEGDLTRPWAAPLVVLLGGLVSVLVALQRGTGDRDLAFLLQLTITVYAGVRLALVVVRGRVRPLRGTFWLFVYAAMGIAPLVQLLVAQFPTPFVGSRSHLTTALLLVLLGCVAFDVGDLVGSRRRREQDAPDEPAPPPSAPAASALPAGADDEPVLDLRVYRLLLIGSALALVMSAVLVLRLGGLGTFFSSRQAVSESLGAAGLSGDSQVGSALVRGGGTVPVLMFWLALTRVLVVRRAARRSAVLVGAWCALALGNLVVNNPVSNPRYWALTVLLSFVLVLVGNRPRWFRRVLLGGLVAAVVVFPYADRFRYDEAGYRPLETDSLLTTMALKDFDQTVMVANTVAYTQIGAGHTDGRQLAGALLFFVPRAMWPDKPQDTGVVVGEWLGTANTNLSAPLWTELWIDAGLLGVVVGFTALGFAAARLDRTYLRALRTGSVSTPVLVVVPVLAGYAFILLRGSLLQAMGRLAILGAVAVVLAVWDRQVRSAELPGRGPDPLTGPSSGRSSGRSSGPSSGPPSRAPAGSPTGPPPGAGAGA